MPETSTLSEADPLTVNGSGDVLFSDPPLAGEATDDKGGVISSVVYENG
jgi:hypothetical protein